MQSKGKLGSIVAGVIAIFLVLVCLFYLSFSFTSSSYENKAEQYARTLSGNNDDSAYNQAYKHYMDSVGDEKVYMGLYTLNDVRKWGVGLGLDLKGGMNVILEVDIPDMLHSISNKTGDEKFEAAVDTTAALARNDASIDFLDVFVKQYRQREPDIDLSVVFKDNLVPGGSSDAAVVGILKDKVKSITETAANSVLRKRIDQFGVVSPNIQVLQGKDGQVLLELPGVKDHQRVRELLQRSATLEFYDTYLANEVQAAIGNLLQRAMADTTVNARALEQVLANRNAYGAASTVLGYANSAMDMAAVNTLISSPLAKSILPGDLLLLWGVKEDTRTSADGKK